MKQLTEEDIYNLSLSEAGVEYVNMLLKHAYQKGQASMMSSEQ